MNGIGLVRWCWLGWPKRYRCFLTDLLSMSPITEAVDWTVMGSVETQANFRIGSRSRGVSSGSNVMSSEPYVRTEE